LRDDITSISFQHPHYNPNETVELEFTLGHHSFLFEPGDKLRLDVSSSAYPLFHPHTNRKGLQAAQNGADIAVNTIVTGPSNIRFYESN
jgi:predicted acyl esterase